MLYKKKDDRIATQSLEIFIDKVLIVILACVKIIIGVYMNKDGLR